MREALRSFLYASGAFSVFHRWRNRNRLTVVMFHRVLPREGDAYSAAEREFTFSLDGFRACLDFFGRHYRVVALQDVAASVIGEAPLPKCPLLITFDDGWRDTLEYAYPELAARRMPVTVFVSSEVLELPGLVWWQDRLVSVLQTPEGQSAFARQLGNAKSGTGGAVPLAHRAAAWVASHPLGDRLPLIETMAGTAGSATVSNRQMLNHADLVRLSGAAGVSIGAHGHSHAPLTETSSAESELLDSHRVLLPYMPSVKAMSFPHGARSDELTRQAASAGFQLVFNSAPFLNKIGRVDEGPVELGRIHLPENEWTSEGGRISAARLATFLFFRPAQVALGSSR